MEATCRFVAVFLCHTYLPNSAHLHWVWKKKHNKTHAKFALKLCCVPSEVNRSSVPGFSSLLLVAEFSPYCPQFASGSWARLLLSLCHSCSIYFYYWLTCLDVFFLFPCSPPPFYRNPQFLWGPTDLLSFIVIGNAWRKRASISPLMVSTFVIELTDQFLCLQINILVFTRR